MIRSLLISTYSMEVATALTAIQTVKTAEPLAAFPNILVVICSALVGSYPLYI